MDIQRWGQVLSVCQWFRWCLCCYRMFLFPRKDVEMRVTVEHTKSASVLLIRKLFLLMQNLKILPNNVCLTMKLYYHDDSECVGPQVVEAVVSEITHLPLPLSNPSWLPTARIQGGRMWHSLVRGHGGALQGGRGTDGLSYRESSRVSTRRPAEEVSRRKPFDWDEAGRPERSSSEPKKQGRIVVLWSKRSKGLFL